jgi:hypothetical protein
LLESHLGVGHEVVSSDRVLQGEILKSEIDRCLEYLEDHKKSILTYKEAVVEKILNHRQQLKLNTQMLIQEINSQTEETLANCEQLMYTETD